MKTDQAHAEDADTEMITGSKAEKPKLHRRLLKWLSNSENLLVSLTVVAVVLGMLVGFLVRGCTEKNERTVQLVSFPGDLLMNMLKMLIIPLIVSSLVSGLSALDAKSSGKMGSYALIYYFSTTMMAVVLGIILVVAIHPGNEGIKEKIGEGTTNKKMPSTLDAFLDLFRNIFPPNIVQATIQQYQSKFENKTFPPKYVKKLKRPENELKNKTNNVAEMVLTAAKFDNITIETPVVKEVIVPTFTDATNVLGIVTFSIFFGMILGRMGKKAEVMIQFFVVLNEVVMQMVRIIMWYSPIGIFFLIVGKILDIDDLAKTAAALGLYMLTVLLGLLIHSCVSLAGVFYLITRKNPLVYFKGIFQAWITALGTASSAATLPITFRCLEENNGIDQRVTRFVLPIGATINMDGTALYEAVASIFIAQINGMNLNAGQIITVSLTATLAAIGAASVPSAGLVTMILVLTSVGLPINDISLIFAVDWMLDRIRTSINVLGDAFGAGIVAHMCRHQLAEVDRLAAEEAEMAELAEVKSDDEFRHNEHDNTKV